MAICKVKGCKKLTQYKNTKHVYCLMHLARLRRHGYTETKKQKGEHSLEKLPHGIVDKFIIKNCKRMNDKRLVEKLKTMGFSTATEWNVKYRRRKLGIKKYLYGEIKKHKAWIRDQAIKRYGSKCELCFYGSTIDTHHVIPKFQGGLHSIQNLMILCPNCHALVTRNIIQIRSREEIPELSKNIRAELTQKFNTSN